VGARCKLHCGRTPNHRKAAALQAARTELAGELDAIGLDPRTLTDPIETLVTLLPVAGERLAFARRKLAELAAAGKDDRAGSGDAAAYSKMEIEAIDLLARLAKLAHGTGVSERRTQLAEASAAQWGPVVREILDRIDLTSAQRARAREVVRDVLTGLERRPGLPAAIDSTAEEDAS
jgi:hypothetical protein